MHTDYWSLRLNESIEKANNASSRRNRLAYLELAAHYRAMHEMFANQATLAPLPSAVGREVAPGE